MILPHAVAFNEPAIPEVMDLAAGALGSDLGAATGLYNLVENLGAPTALRDIGMKEENLDEAVDLILGAAPKDNPRPVDEAGVRGILDGAYTGRRPGKGARRAW